MAGNRTEVMIPVPDVRIGAVIGKGGEIITQLKTLVGVKIRISDRDNFVPGTRDRKVTPQICEILFYIPFLGFRCPPITAVFCKKPAAETP